MKNLLIIILIVLISFIGCRNLRSNLNGVWRGEKSDLLIIISFDSSEPYIKVNGETYRVLTSDVVSNNTAVVATVRRNNYSEIWTFRATWEDYTKSYSLFWKKQDGFEDKLLFMRNL